MKETKLTEKQQSCVDFPLERDLIVTGLAGSGKSLVVVKRALRFSRLAREKGGRIRIGLFTYVNSLVSYTKEILDEGGEELQNDIEVTTLDKVILRLYKAVVGKRIDFDTLYNSKKHQTFLNDVVTSTPVPSETSRRTILSEERRDWLMEEVSWIKQHMYSEVDEYLTCVRKGRGRIQLKKEDRPFVFEIYQRYYKELEKAGIQTIDMICEQVFANRKKISDMYRYDLVLLDEAQDLPLNKLLIARELATLSVTIAADFAQKIYHSGFTWKEIGLDIKGKGSQKLKGTFRNTKQIALLANSLQCRNTEEFEDGDLTPLELPEREGPLPRLIYCQSPHEEAATLIGILQKILDDAPESTVGVFARDYEQMLQFGNILRNGNIPYEQAKKKGETTFLKPGIKLITYHSAKGLEFDQVILPFVDDTYFPYTIKSSVSSNEALEDLMNNARSLLFVGMTRAHQMLYILTTDGDVCKPSPLLEELDHTKMDIVR